MSVYGRAVCKLTVFSSQERKTGLNNTRLKATTAVNSKFMLIWFVNQCSLLQGYKYLVGKFSLHLQDILKKVAVLSP